MFFLMLFQIRHSLVPVLLLATVAFSSSNVLPVLSINQLESEPVGLKGQLNDNILSNRNEPRNILNDIFYTISIATPLDKKQQNELQYMDINNNTPDDESYIFNREGAYNGEGFRKEQWHNYPRQLDRLHEYLYEHHNTDKRNPDPGGPYDYNDDTAQINLDNELKTNEFHLSTKDENGYETAAISPFLIFKIHLACLNNKLKNTNANSAPHFSLSEPEYIPNDKKEMYENDKNPEVSVTKVKREEESGLQNVDIPGNSITKNRAVKKRIFSLWSRLQSFNHKGHELQHRRHLHAFYGLPEGDGGGGVLTAETRATFMRPPGSPLRWG
ncbi:unnamed protein product [Diatraea saccharalis]|uniref:Uncharacterized protein n=1 Tax=Diatraea saccharalis TaxID=40085 RepID=A0A9N9QTS0_9NEOP|nr:unnamed protein product [Diatraea saccharalis]